MQRRTTNCFFVLMMFVMVHQVLAQQQTDLDRLLGREPNQVKRPIELKVLFGGEKANRPLEMVMNPFIDNSEIAGAVGLVADKEGVIAVQSAGLADIASLQAMTRDSVFWIASMSKPVTGACIMVLQDEGKLSLDDPITKHLPEMKDLKLADGSPAVITIRQLLSHTSGMAELKQEEAYTARDLAEAATRYAKVRVLFTPGSKWQYSQTGINTAGRIVEVVSGLTLDEFIEKRICEPLEMHDTGFYLSKTQAQRLAKSYRKNDEGRLEEAKIGLLAGFLPTDRERMPAANGGLFSTAEDYAKFCRMLLRGGELDGKRILSAEAVKSMRTIVTGELVTGFTPGNGWGIGCCVVREPQGVTQSLAPGSFGHGGAYGTQAWIDPTNERIYILMTQRANFPNADASDLRREFQKVAKTLTR
jgi:CubicO group peptidase (beta-lactamase class C family)